MNAKAHKEAACSVNRHISNPFPERPLAKGAADPDKRRTSYKGKERKHHYDISLMTLFSNRDEHGPSTIRSIVWKRVVRARRAWLRGKRSQAAFQFGVASHYLMDGLITSGSVDKREHQSGDRRFSKKILSAVPYSDPIKLHNLADKNFAQQNLSRCRKFFGQNDPNIAIRAWVLLVRIAAAVTEDPVPDKVKGEAEDRIEQGEKHISGLYRSFETVVHNLREELPVWIRSRINEVWKQNGFTKRCLSINEMYRAQDKFNPSVVSRVGAWLFKNGCIKPIVRTVRDLKKQQKRKRKRLWKEIRVDFRQIGKTWSSQKGWFNVKEYLKKQRKGIREKIKKCRKDESAQLKKIKHQANSLSDHELKPKAVSHLAEWWPHTFRYRLAKITAGQTWNKGLIALISFVPFYIPSLIFVIQKMWHRLGFAILCYLPWIIYALIHIKHYENLNLWMHLKLTVSCPRCTQRFSVNQGLKGLHVRCPSCETELNIPDKTCDNDKSDL